MKKLMIFITLLLISATAFSNTQRVPTVNSLTDFISKFSSNFISLYADTEDDQHIFRLVKFAHNEDVDAAVAEDIWAAGGKMTYPTAAETLTVVSSSTADDSGSTGANTILLACIQSDGTETDLSVTMDGTTPVVTTQTCKFINRVQVTLSGSGKTNTGVITITNTTSGDTLATVEAGESVTHQIYYRVPSDRRCHINSMYFTANKLSGGATPRVIFKVLSFSEDTNTFYNIRRELIDTNTESVRTFPNFRDRALLPGEILTIEATTNTNDTQVSAAIDITCREI